jgi:hypothetical protein
MFNMKVIISCIFLVMTASICLAFNANQAANQSISRREILDGILTAAVATSVVLTIPSSAIAKNPSPLPPINGIYSDPNHLEGYRIVRALDASNALVTLQDKPNGPVISVNGKIAGTTVTLDFSAKGGPKDVVATLVGDDKLSFPDGNTWTKISGMGGVYNDPNHPSGYRVVRVAKGGNVFITLQDEPDGDVLELQGNQMENGSMVSIDFSPKGGPSNLTATAKDGKLVFPDGNAWTKI